MNELTDASAVALAAAIRGREVSSVEVVTAHVGRIAAVNPRLNAVVQLTADAALAEARDADAALARGRIGGPFQGVPFTVKDVFDVARVVSAVGLEERAAFIPERDATVVARLRAAGAILLGKTNCPPGGAGGDTANPVYGTTVNPYDSARTPGGSSGGEAAIIAAGGSPFGIGSDSGGSFRLPAHYCGVAGLKPTFGRVPNTGAYDHPGGLTDPRTQVGPLARSVEDLAPALASIAGPDWRDSSVVPMPLGDPGTVALAGLKVAWYDDDGIASPSPDTARTIRDAARALADAGLLVENARPPAIADSLDITRRYWRSAELHGAQIEHLMRDWDAFRTGLLVFMERFDAILCAVSDRPALPLGTTDDERFSYTLPFSLTGNPCAVVRAGTSADGLPIGVQIVARPWRDDIALAVAGQIERALGGWRRSPV